MPTFSYVATDQDGKVHRGRAEADSPQHLIDRLTESGYRVKSVSDDKDKARRSRLPPTIQKLFISHKEVRTFTRQLVEMLNEGQRICPALQTLAKRQPNKHLQQVIVQVEERIETGESLSDALAARRDVFGEEYIAAVRHGEESGNPKDLLLALSSLAGTRASESHSDLNWQKIEQDDHGAMFRAKVPGGWLIKATYFISLPVHTEATRIGTSIAFYPDARHEWDGTSLD